MSEGHHCPAEGCDYGTDEKKTATSVKRHIRAKADAAHADNDTLQQQVDQQGSDEQDDQDGEQDEPAETTEIEGDEGDDPADEGDDDQGDQQDEQETMPTDEEYQQQQAGGRGADDGDDDGVDDTSDEGGESSGFLPKMSTTTMVYLVGFVLLALLVYTLLSERGDDDQAVDVEVEEEEA